MSDERTQVLEMLSAGKISVSEAQMLPDALSRSEAPEPECLPRQP